jgi:glycosyltransferase involved in cell wall biosynthesis
VRRLLFVANPFPPMASGGTARQLRFLRYLREFDWEPTVLTCRADGPVPTPADLRVVRTPTPSPEPLYRAARQATAAWADRRRGRHAGHGEPRAASAPAPDRRALSGADRRTARRELTNRWLFVPDQYAAWGALAVAHGLRLVRDEHFDAVFSSSPRGSTQLAAAGIAALSGLPWLADYRDPWPTRQFRVYPTAAHRRANFALERWSLSHARSVTAVNEQIADDLRRRYPSLTARVTVLPNGFDDGEVCDPVAAPPGFWFVHTGRLYGRDAQIAAFLDALAELPDDTGVIFVGVDGRHILAYAAALGIAHRVRVEPFGPHARALGFQRSAAALLLVTGRAPESLSGKIFEYLSAGPPIFAITPDHSAAAALLDEAGGAHRAAPDRPLTGALASFVAAARGGDIAPPDRAVVNRYDGRVLTGRLAELLAEMVAARRG